MKYIINKIYDIKPWVTIHYLGKLPFMTNIYQYFFYKFSGPKSVKIHINSQCNFNCIYCYSDPNRKSLSTIEWLNFIETLDRKNINTIEISGGEPFLDKGLYKILKKCKKKKYKITIYTNGTFVNMDWIKKLKHLKAKIIISIKYDHRISYKELTRTNKFDKVENNIKNLIKNNIHVVCFISVTNKSFPFIKKIINKAIDLGAFPVLERFIPVKNDTINNKLIITKVEWSLCLQLIKKVYKKYEKIIDGVNRIQGSICSCYLTQFSVMQEGSILPCQFLPLSQRLGNIKKEPIDIIWNRFMKKRKKWIKIPKSCQNCNNKLLCKGGCKSSTYFKYKKYDKKDPLCSNNIPSDYGLCGFIVIHKIKSHRNNLLCKI